MIRQAEAKDAQNLIEFLDIVGAESHFLTMDEKGCLMNEAEMSSNLTAIANAENNVYFLAFLDGQIAGVFSISADFHYRIHHIGDIFIAVRTSAQGHGIGSKLFVKALNWLENESTIKRLELTVQKRNTVAQSLYKKFGFELESIRQKGARDENGKLIDVCEMVKFYD